MTRLRYVLALVLSVGILFSSVAVFAQPVHMGDTSSQQACETIKNLNPNGGGCTASQGGVNRIIRFALNLLSIVAGIIAVIMVIVSGFKYITSQGDSNQISSAKNSLIYAIVGVVVLAFAQAIVKFVLKKSINA